MKQLPVGVDVLSKWPGEDDELKDGVFEQFLSKFVKFCRGELLLLLFFNEIRLEDLEWPRI